MPGRWNVDAASQEPFFDGPSAGNLEELNGKQISGGNRGRVSEEERLAVPAGRWDDIFCTKLSSLTVNTQLTLLLLFLCAYNLLQWPETKPCFSMATIWVPLNLYFFIPFHFAKHSCSFWQHGLCSRQPCPWNAACLLPACVPSSQLLAAFWLIDRRGSLISDNSTYDKLNNHLMNWLTSEGFDLMHNPSHR